MAGILDNKERVLDFIITTEGKRQASSGQMKIEYASITDMHTFYAASGTAPSIFAADASDRIYFEASNRYQDVIVPELEAGNSLRPFRTDDFEFTGQTIASGTFRVGFQKKGNIITGSQIRKVAKSSLKGITKNFNDLRILGTEDPFAQTNGFSVTKSTGSFYVWENVPMEKTFTGDISLEESPSLFADRRFSHFANFAYLPPINIPTPGKPVGAPLGIYPRLNEPEILSFEQLRKSLNDKQLIDIEFTDTSRDNNLIGQFFEFSSTGIEKLSIVDFGEFDDNDPFSRGKRVFFVGKMYRDANGAETYMNIFTVVFD